MEIKTVLINIGISILVAILTAKLSLNGFYKQEIWLRKEKKYSQLLEQLSILEKHYSDMIDEVFSPDFSDGEPSDYEEDYKKVKREIELISSGSNLILSNESTECIKHLLKEMNNRTKDEIAGDYFSYVDRIHYEIMKTREKIFEIAKNDLKIKT